MQNSVPHTQKCTPPHCFFRNFARWVVGEKKIKQKLHFVIQVPSLFERVFLNNQATLEKEQTAGLSHLGARLKKSWEPAVGLNTKVTMVRLSS